MRRWWRVYGPKYRGAGGGLRIVTVWRGPQVIGILPLYLGVTGGPAFGVRHLRFLSTGEEEFEETNPDYLDLLCRPDEELACAGAVQDYLARATWDHLELLDVPESSPLTGEGFRAAVGGARILYRGTCPVADLEGGFEAYLQRLSAKNRQGARRMLREAEKSGAVFELAREGQTDEYFDDLVRLHQHRWTTDGKQGCFAASRFTEFHRTLAAEWVPQGRAVLARLSVAGNPVAVVYGFRTGPKFDFYQSGVLTDDGMLTSPGILANLLLARMLAERGLLAYDYLRGTSSYKERFATRKNQLVSLDFWRHTLRATIHLSARFLRRTANRGLQTLRITRAAPPQLP
jgi:hypothetical protein